MITSAKSRPLSLDAMAPPWPITFDDVLQARERLSPYLSVTPLRHYPLLDEQMGGGTMVIPSGAARGSRPPASPSNLWAADWVRT